MTVTKVSLSNLALLKLGKAPIISMTEGTDQANVMNMMFEEIKVQVLLEGPWSFSLKRIELGQLVSTPEYDFVYEYQLPADCLRVLEVHDNLDGYYEFRIEGRKLLSNRSTEKILYISDVTEPNDWSPKFREALILRLAAEASYRFRASDKLTQLLFAQYRDAVDMGLAIDNKQGSAQMLSSPDLTEVR